MWLKIILLFFVHLTIASYFDMPQILIEKQYGARISISSKWQVLGPFQIGTREASWGSDPLEYYGGFSSLKYDPNVTYPSSLTTNGTATWSIIEANTSSSTSSRALVPLSVGYSNVDWKFLQAVYGWAALQYQAWARAELWIDGKTSQSVVLYTEALLEFRVNGKPYFGGDFYSFRKAPLILQLEPGTHSIEVRLIRDVRAFGGIGNPTIDVKIEAQLASSLVEVAKSSVLVSHVIDGSLASPYVSVALRNTGISQVEVIGISTTNTSSATAVLDSKAIRIFPGQTKPVNLFVTLNGSNATSISFALQLQAHTSDSGEAAPFTVDLVLPLIHKSMYDPHKVTHLHPSGIISYHVLRAPSRNAHCSNKTASILLQLHGAGVETDSDVVVHTMDPLPDLCAFVVFASGVTAWSGDDWHTWGFADVEAAIASIPKWITHNKWDGVSANIDRWFVAGHSNGGQGTWYTLTHRPDKVFAAAPVSGYLSIQAYVPYQLWQPASPSHRRVLDSATLSYRHELLAANAKGIPIFQQHGSADDNVPTYHSRFMHLLLAEAGIQSTYNELPGVGHYFDGIMTTDGMSRFYNSQFGQDQNISEPIFDFEIIVANPADMGSKGGIRVTHLIVPGEHGKVHVRISQNQSAYDLETVNILSMELGHGARRPGKLIIDGQDLDLSLSQSQEGIRVVSNVEGIWHTTSQSSSSKCRKGKQLGALDAILTTVGPLQIRASTQALADIAVQVSRNMFQYFSADSDIFVDSSGGSGQSLPRANNTGNQITILVGAAASYSNALASFPLNIKENKIAVRDVGGRWHEYSSEGVSAIYLAPLEDRRLELVIWGSDDRAVASAARLVPTMTGVGQPDFIILSRASAWKGVGGTLAMGFFDHSWNVSTNSVIS